MPRMHGFPPMTRGFVVIRASAVTAYPRHQPARPTQGPSAFLHNTEKPAAHQRHSWSVGSSPLTRHRCRTPVRRRPPGSPSAWWPRRPALGHPPDRPTCFSGAASGTSARAQPAFAQRKRNNPTRGLSACRMGSKFRQSLQHLPSPTQGPCSPASSAPRLQATRARSVPDASKAGRWSCVQPSSPQLEGTVQASTPRKLSASNPPRHTWRRGTGFPHQR